MNRSVPALTLIALFCGATVVHAQSAIPVETVQADGSVVPLLALTPTQRGAVYNSVRRQRVDAATDGDNAAIAAPAAQSLALPDIPDVPALADDSGDFLKYATVAGDVVIVDPIRMHVVEVIRSGVGP